MRRFLFIVAASFAVVSGASAAPGNSHQVAFIDATCTGLGAVTLVNAGPAHTEALQVLGTNTVVLVPFNGAPGIISAGTASGTTCTFAENPTGGPTTVPVVIING